VYKGALFVGKKIVPQGGQNGPPPGGVKITYIYIYYICRYEIYIYKYRGGYNIRSAVSELKPSSGSRSGFKNPLELLGSSRYNRFSRRR
jgi:hypothetical protein